MRIPFRARPATIESKNIKRLQRDGLTPTAIAKELGIARSSVYRMLDQIELRQTRDEGIV